MNVPAAALAEKINGLMGGGYHTYFVNSGSEANEAGFKIARQYMKHEYPGRISASRPISRYFAYHGTTLATLGRRRHGRAQGEVRAVLGRLRACRAAVLLSLPVRPELSELRPRLRQEHGDARSSARDPETVAEVIVEPIMSGVGVAVPPDEYLPEVESLCRKYGILLHVDEVINGFGRTGKMFAHQHYGVSPDIIAVAKGISSAYLPIAATVVKNSVFDSFYGDPAENRQVAQVNTYGGHPVAAAVALRNIEIMEAERLADRAAEMGAYLLDGLRGLMRHKIVGDVRGKGLLIGVELVKDRATKEPVDAAQITAVVDFCRDHGVIVGRAGGGRRYGNTITLSPAAGDHPRRVRPHRRHAGPGAGDARYRLRVTAPPYLWWPPDGAERGAGARTIGAARPGIWNPPNPCC